MGLDLSVQINRMKAHIAADELVRGVGFEDGRGCFVGCTVDAYDHQRCADETGVPRWVWHLCDTLHEDMSDGINRGDMALRLLHAFERCDDFDAVERGIHVFIQRRNLERVQDLDIPTDLKDKIAKAIESVIAYHESTIPTEKQRAAAASAARSAARSAEYDAIGKELLRLLEGE